MPDLNSPEVKEQFDQLGMSPQEASGKSRCQTNTGTNSTRCVLETCFVRGLFFPDHCATCVRLCPRSLLIQSLPRPSRTLRSVQLFAAVNFARLSHVVGVHTSPKDMVTCCCPCLHRSNLLSWSLARILWRYPSIRMTQRSWAS